MTGMVDVHCHILPGVDDGARTPADTKAMLEMQYEQGVRRIIVTPHLRRDMFETPADVIEEAFLKTKELARQVAGDLMLYLGCEYHVTSEMTEVLRNDWRRRMAGTKYVLTEFSGSASFESIRKKVNEILQYGFRPIVAHVERCMGLAEKPENLDELAEMGAYVQVNASSVIGEDGRTVKAFCKRIIKDQQVHLIASDAHDCKRRAPNLGACAQYLSKKFGDAVAEKLLITNPTKLISNDYM